jgi:hypothetical protein
LRCESDYQRLPNGVVIWREGYAEHLKVRGEDGHFDVVGHGTPSDISGMNASEVADSVRGSAGFNGQDVRLLSCETGSPEESFAQDLADNLGVNVQAPTSNIYVSGRGGISFDPNGSFQVFGPS